MAGRFDEETIQQLFGNEAAENEKPERLKEYYFKSDVYSKINNELPLRILVGHKGVGKSALFKIALLENLGKNNLAIWVKPDDILGINTNQDDVLQSIRDWKIGIEKMIISLVLQSLKIPNAPDIINKALVKGKGVIKTLTEIFGKKAEELGVDTQRANKEIIKSFLSKRKLHVFIDDLDRGWKGDGNSISRISALLNAVRDMATENEGLYFRISLRSDVYYLVRTSDESTDKIDGSVIWLSWTQHQLLVVLAKRIDTFFGRKSSERELMKRPQFVIAEHFAPVLEDDFHGSGKWSDVKTYRVLATLIRKRPRDLVKLCTLAAREAFNNHHDIIKSEDLNDVFDRYSQDRILDTINEHKYELKDIKRLLLSMRPSKREKKAGDAFIYSTESIMQKLKNISKEHPFHFAVYEGELNTQADEQSLLEFLYKINFLVGRKRAENGEIDRRYFEDQNYLSNAYVDFGYSWEIHPAFRWGLYPEARDAIFNSIDFDASF